MLFLHIAPLRLRRQEFTENKRKREKKSEPTQKMSVVRILLIAVILQFKLLFVDISVPLATTFPLIALESCHYLTITHYTHHVILINICNSSSDTLILKVLQPGFRVYRAYLLAPDTTTICCGAYYFSLMSSHACRPSCSSPSPREAFNGGDSPLPPQHIDGPHCLHPHPGLPSCLYSGA